MSTTDHPRLIALSIPHGPQPVQVGSAVYHVPASAGVAPGPSGLVYILANAKIHCVSERGEISIPNRLRHVLASAYFGASRPRAQT